MELFKTPFGSRLYGTFTETSDHDWKVIHLPEVRYLLIGDKVLKNKFYSTSSKEFKNNADDTDTEYIALQTLARDVVAGQAYAIEVAFAMLGAEGIEGAQFLNGYKHSTYVDGQWTTGDYPVRTFVKELLEKFLTNQMNGMVGYAYHQAKLYSAKGDRLNFAQDVYSVFQAAIDRGEGEKTIHNLSIQHDESGCAFEQGLDKLQFDHGEWLQYKPMYINETPDRYISIQLFKKTYLGTSKISHVAGLIKKVIEQYGSRAHKAAENEGHDWKALSHAVRVTFQAIELLEKGSLVLPYNQHICNVLKEIKSGEMEFSTVSALLDANIELIDNLKLTTTLQPYTEELQKEFEEWLSYKMMKFYDL
jgi:predicted nucleotidyltransferase